MTTANESAQVESNSDKGFVVRSQQEQYLLTFLLPFILTNDKIKESARYHNNFVWNGGNSSNGNLDLFKNFAKKSAAAILNKIPPAALSSLTPQIRLFKTFYNDKGKPQLDWEIPFTDYVKDQDITDILTNRRGTLNGANIIDFSYSFIGTNPAEAESCLKAKLSLKFQSIDALLTPIDVSENRKFRYSDLALQNSKTKEDGNLNPDYYRLKALVGYKTDKKTIDTIGFKVEGKKTEDIVKAINSSATVMQLYPTIHEISFEKNGTIGFSIEYRGAIESIYNDPFSDIFLCSSEGKSLVDKIKESRQKKKERKKALEDSKVDTTRNCLDTESAEYKSKKEKFDEEEKAADKEIVSLSNKLYSAFYSDLLTSQTTGVKFLEGNDLQKKLGTDSGVFSDSQETNEEILSNAKLGFSSSQFLELGNSINVGVLNDAELQTKIQQVQKAISADPSKDISPSSLQTSKENQISFILLGDIIDFIYRQFRYNAESLGNITAEEIPTLILGDISIIIPSKFGNTIAGKGITVIDEDVINDNGLRFSQYNVPLSQMPISMNFFNKWYLEKVIKPKRDKFPIQVFLNEIIDLIRLSSIMVFGNKYASFVNSRTVGLSLSVNKTLTDKLRRPNSGEGEVGANGPIDFSTISNEEISPGSFSFEEFRASNSRDIHIIFVSTIPIKNIDPREIIKNEEKGIVTYTIGSQQGILKDASFKRMNIPFQKESKMTLDNSLSRGVLRMKYNCGLTMYGPSLYNPGDVIIINPVFLSSGRTTTAASGEDRGFTQQKLLANELGLGGIYVVNKADTKLASGVCETNLDCIFLQYGAGTIEVGSGAAVRGLKEC